MAGSWNYSREERKRQRESEAINLVLDERWAYTRAARHCNVDHNRLKKILDELLSETEKVSYLRR